ncbi:MAG: protein kinase domain-containing protein, partial [Verrucomicrobiota bacterium]
MPLNTGTRLGSYEILSPIGAGGLGEVYRAWDTKLNREVAVKVLPEHLARDADARSRFEREAQAVAALSHPNILAIHDFGVADGVAYSVTELLEGETLRSRLSASALHSRKAIDFALQIARGLAAAHERGIVHRELKPENVFLTRDGHVKILDFGLARMTGAGEGGAATNAPTVEAAGTAPGTVMGTMGYMSPEQVRGKTADHRTDIFSFGAVLYEMLSGRRAFRGDSAADTMTAILKEEPPDLSETNHSVPTQLERLVRHCLEKNPEDRFQSARDLAYDLEAISGLSSSGSRTGGLPPAARPLPRVALPVTVAAVAVALALGWLAARRFGTGRGDAGADFHQLTFRRGFIGSARFAADGQSVVFSAQWDGLPAQLFLKRPEAPDALSLQLPPAEVLAVSSTGQAAVSLGCKLVHNGACAGTLAVVPLTGGAPRPLEDGIQWADWSPDGSAMTLVHDVEGKAKLELPAGKVLYETAGHISWPRFSPDGKRIAFLDHPFAADDRGAVALADLAGKRTKLSREYESIQGLAWSPDGREVWFTAAESGAGRSLRAVTLSGKERVVSKVPGGLTLRDIAKSGRVLLTHDNVRKGIMGLGPGQAKERELSWLEWSLANDLSDDGATLLFNEQGQAVGEDYAICLRKTDGSPVIRLGDGIPRVLSPDGKWVVSTMERPGAPLTLLPTGTGQPHTLPSLRVSQYGPARRLPDGRRFLFAANEVGKTRRLYLQDIDAGPPRAVSPPDLAFTGFVPSADGRSVYLQTAPGKFVAVPVDGGAVRPAFENMDLTNLAPIRFSGDGRILFARDNDRIPVSLYRFDVASGRREVLRELSPGDPAGLQGIGIILLSSDGRFYAYGYTRA